jgi:hypothetical protein
MPEGAASAVKKAAKSANKAAPKKRASAPSKSGHPANADGRPAVEAWLDHVKPEQQRLVRRLDALIVQAMPRGVSVVKFRKPTNPWGVLFYGLPGRGWIVSVNSLKAQVRVIFFAGNSLKPMPPLAAPPRARAIDVYGDKKLDERQITAWLKQAMKLPGWGRV